VKPIRIQQSRYLNNRIEQDHRRIKRRIPSMLGFKFTSCAATILSGIEKIHMMRKRQASYAYNPAPSLAEQFSMNVSHAGSPFSHSASVRAMSASRLCESIRKLTTVLIRLTMRLVN
jgi:hypothetical protein